MSHTKGNGTAKIGKSLFIAALKFAAILIAFVCKILGLFLTKMGEIFEKLSGGNGHH